MVLIMLNHRDTFKAKTFAIKFYNKLERTGVVLIMVKVIGTLLNPKSFVTAIYFAGTSRKISKRPIFAHLFWLPCRESRTYLK